MTEFAANVGYDLSEDERQKFFTLLRKCADISAGSGGDIGRTSKLTHRIDTGTTPPIRQPVRHISPQRRDEVRQLIWDMLSKGVIERSTSPWSSPIVLVREKVGSIRFCMDYRKVNDVTRKDAYPLPPPPPPQSMASSNFCFVLFYIDLCILCMLGIYTTTDRCYT